MSSMIRLVLIRHGQSLWNKAHLFTGGTDVELSEKGIEEATEAGRRMKAAGFKFDLGYTSVLLRATRTLDLALQQMGLSDIEIRRSWRLNERHYGALQGESKVEKAKEVGEEQVHIWRRSFDVPPPALDEDDERHPRFDEKYKDLDPSLLPACESLKDTIERFLPYWEEEIVPSLKAGRQVIISAHGNSLRALVKHLDQISDEEISSLNIPTGVPLVYELDDDLKPIKSYYLED